MEREYKFRVYDRKNQIMHEVRTLKQLFFATILIPEGSEDAVWSNLVVMQFTGMQDKYKRDIYEGDIVRIHNYEEKWKHREPDIDWRVFGVVHNQYVYAFENSVIYTPFSRYDGSNLQDHDIEILGNIYQNPELIQ